MSYPWPSFGTFMFLPEERALWETDAGWSRTPSYDRVKALGSSTDVITALAIGSAERTFELMMTPDRVNALETMINTRAILTDWSRPTPDSRLAFFTELTRLSDIITQRGVRVNTGTRLASTPLVAQHKQHIRLSFISA